jgi:hypothetical protein
MALQAVVLLSTPMTKSFCMVKNSSFHYFNKYQYTGRL